MSTAAFVGLIARGQSDGDQDRVSWWYCHTDGGSVGEDLASRLASARSVEDVESAVRGAFKAVEVESPWPTPLAYMVDVRVDLLADLVALRLEDGEHRGGWWAARAGAWSTCWRRVSGRRFVLSSGRTGPDR